MIGSGDELRVRLGRRYSFICHSVHRDSPRRRVVVPVRHLSAPPHKGSGTRWDEAPTLLREVAAIADGMVLFAAEEPVVEDWFMEIFDLGSYQHETKEFLQLVNQCRSTIAQHAGPEVLDWLLRLHVVGRTKTGTRLAVGRAVSGPKECGGSRHARSRAAPSAPRISAPPPPASSTTYWRC